MKYAVIGRNIDYSLSPKIHQANFRSLKIDASYQIVNVSDITEEIGKLRQFMGFNVTIPYKEEMVKICDTLDEDAIVVQAVNCVKVVNNKFHGYNTDVYGFYMLLKNNDLLKYKNAKVLIIGAGGAAKAVYHCFEKHTNYDVTIANRTIEKALDITSQVSTIKDAEEKLYTYDLVVNATSLGVLEDKSPLSIKKIKKDCVFIDVNYQETKFLTDVKQFSGKAINGVDMLIYQAAKSFEIWFSKKANSEIMKNCLRKD